MKNTKHIQKIKICRTATVAYYVKNHLRSQVEYLRDKGMMVVIISSHGPDIHQIKLDKNLLYENIEIARQIDPIKDLMTLIKLFKIFRKYRFDIVHSTTPKAGLLSSIAAFFSGVPLRLHTWTGQPWVTQKGIKKVLTRFSDKLIGFLNTRCYADSPSQRDFLIRERIISPERIRVHNKGSISGINIEKFNPEDISQDQKNSLKKELGISDNSKILTFIGRINKDKGVTELLSAFIQTLGLGYDIDLLLVGPMDQDSEGRGLERLEEYLKNHSRIHYVGYQKFPEQYLAVTDIFCLPSYREGFGTTVIEAAAMGVPSVGTKINGLVDAIEDGKTGILVPLKDVNGLVSAFNHLLDCPEELKKMGERARLRCVKDFDEKIINNLVWKEYLDLLQVDNI